MRHPAAPPGPAADYSDGIIPPAALDAGPQPSDGDRRPLAAGPGGGTPVPGAPETEPAPRATPRFAGLPVFVEVFVVPHWVHRRHDGSRWCARWWEHAEAVLRLEALWEAFEVMRREPAPSLSTWIIYHFEPHMRALTDAGGVFYRCDAAEGVHELPAQWELVPAPAGQFALDPAADIQPRQTEGEQR